MLSHRLSVFNESVSEPDRRDRAGRQLMLLASNLPAVSEERTFPAAGERLAAVGFVGTARSLATPSD